MKEFVIECKKGDWHIPLNDNAGLEELCKSLNLLVSKNVAKVKYCGMTVISFYVKNNSNDYAEFFEELNGLQNNA